MEAPLFSSGGDALRSIQSTTFAVTKRMLLELPNNFSQNCKVRSVNCTTKTPLQRRKHPPQTPQSKGLGGWVSENFSKPMLLKIKIFM